MCSQCWNGCGIQVHINNGVITRIDGDPENPHNNGVICAKGQVGPQGIYSPYRIKRPLIRTNPEKGLDVDPRWKEITWEEALKIVADHLKAIKEDDPRKLLFCSFDPGGTQSEFMKWTEAFGSPNFTPWSADFFCGNSVHSLHYLNQATHHGGVDFGFCKYLLQLGTQWGAVVNTDVLSATRELAEARAESKMKVVVVDPWCSFAGSKADEWIPIRPGTDTAFVLSLVNVIINEIGTYDEPYLKLRTNAPYLVGKDKLYLKEMGTVKPLIWDVEDNRAKPFDDPSIKDYALLGHFTVSGSECSPSFQLIKDEVKKYTPESVSKITTIPKETIRRIAKEWVEQARIGETVEIEGKKIPLRPVSINWYRGTSAHKHSTAIGYAIMMLPTLVGALDVPGGAMGEGRVPNQFITEEGLLGTENKVSVMQPPYPFRPVTVPNSSFYFELFPVAVYSPIMVPLTQMNPEKYKLPYRTEMLIQEKNNLVKSSGPTDMMEKWIKSIPFVVSISTVIDETATMSDLVIPDVYYLERECAQWPQGHPGIQGPYYQYIQQQAVPPPFDQPYNEITSLVDILLDLAERVGFLDEFYDQLNTMYKLKDQYKLQHGEKYTWSQIFDAKMKSSFGDEHGLDWFKKNQVLTWPKNVESAYPGAFRKARLHLYYEFLEQAGREVERVTKEWGVPWDVSDYEAIPQWKPCPSYNPKSKEYDLWIINSKIPTHTLSGSIYYPALLSVTGKHFFDRGVMINAFTATKKGISHGDWMTIETETGKKARARALLTEVCHPEVVVCFGSHGRRTTPNRSAIGVGVDFNQLLELDEDHVDFVDGALDSCIRIKVYKEERGV